MNAKKYKVIIIFLLLSLTSITMFYNSSFIDQSYEVSKNQENDQSVYDKLKLSFFQDWNTSWDNLYDEYGRGIAADESTGDIYVTGYNSTIFPPINRDIILIKYNNSGKELWNVTCDIGSDEYGYDVAIDSSGYIYVAGANYTDPFWDVILLKFNSSGHLEWTRSWDSGYRDGVWALEIDSNDNIYMVGQTFTTSYALLLLKYNSSGHYQWNSTFDGPNEQSGYDLVLDSMNNIYIAGINKSATGKNDLLVAKFDDSGNHIWNKTWGEDDVSDVGYGIALDSRNNVYVTGYTQSYSAGNTDIVTIKYDNDGNRKWNRTWGTSEYDESWSIAIDSADNIYTCGHTPNCNVSILKYGASGNLIWNKTWANNSIYRYWWYDIFIDSLDRIYITGYNRTGGGGDYDLFTAKFSIESPAGFESPSSFILSSNAGDPDADGIFNLNWTVSTFADNYSVYRHSSYITEINQSETLLVDEITDLVLMLSNYSDGTYYFIVVAHNEYGDTLSNCIKVAVEIKKSSHIIPGYNLGLFVATLSVSIVIMVKKKHYIKFKT